MTNHEQMMVCAERYALGRRTYVVGIVTRYISDHIAKMTDHCKEVLIEDIEHPLIFDNYGDDCDKADWMRLLKKLKGEEE